MVLESWYDTKRVVQRYSRSSRHNSREFPTGCSWLPIPQKAAEEVLEAWYYTRHWCRSGPGGLVLHQGGWDRSDVGNWIPGNSRLYSYNSPRMWRRLAQYQRLLGASISKGRCHQYQGSVGDGSERLVYWCSKYTYFGHNFLLCLYFGHCLNLFINFATV